MYGFGRVKRHVGMTGWVREGPRDRVGGARAPTLGGMSTVPLHLEAPPTWRGWMHAAAFFAAIPAGIVLIVTADGATARTAASIYFASLLALFGTSAAYHRLARTPRARAMMQRLDHSMIFFLIAGTYVPICIVALPLSWGIPILCLVGVLGVAGVMMKLSGRKRLDVAASVLYPVTGWLAVIATPALVDNLSAAQLALIVAGGVAYTVGFPVLFLRRPNPWPNTFGYHEIWHACTVVAAVLHFAAVTAVVG
jgi:hemolysin III